METYPEQVIRPNPLKQGLKHSPAIIFEAGFEVIRPNPLKQGLKHEFDNVLVSFSGGSLGQIH